MEDRRSLLTLAVALIASVRFHSQRWNNFDEHCFRVGAPAKWQSNAAETARDYQSRCAARVAPLIQAISALANDRRTIAEAYLAAVGVAGEHERHAARDGVVKMIRIVSQ